LAAMLLRIKRFVLLLFVLTISICRTSFSQSSPLIRTSREGVSKAPILSLDSIYKLATVDLSQSRAWESGATPLAKPMLDQGIVSPSTATKFPFRYNASSRPGTTVCSVVSGRNFLYKDTIYLYAGEPTLTRDGNVIVSGEYFDYLASPRKNGGFCMKTDYNGNVIWSRVYDSTATSHFFINYYKSLELKNGDILLGGRSTNRITISNVLIITRLDNTGNIIWSKTYQSRLWQAGNGSADAFNFRQLVEDTLTGDIYIVGSHWFGPTAVTKLNPSNGQVVWSNAYDSWNSEFPFGMSVFNDKLMLLQLEFYSYNNEYVTGITISKNTGDTLATKRIKQTGDNYTPRIFDAQAMVRLSNGHYMVGGRTTGFWEYPAFTGTKDLYHAGVIELDQNFNFVKGYGFKNRVESNGYNTRVSLFPDGSGVFTQLDYISSFNAETLIVTFLGDQIHHQRKRIHNNEGLPFEPPTLQRPDGGYLNIKNMGDSTLFIYDSVRIDYYRMHPSDTPSVCMGVEDASTSLWYFSFEPYNGGLDSLRRNIFHESHPKTLYSLPFGPTVGPACFTVSNCDSLNISASTSTLCPSTPVVISVYKNPGCGGSIPFNYDTTWVDTVIQLTDTPYAFYFNNTGSGFIKASLLGCTIMRDSVFIQVLDSPDSLNLGPERSLCAGNTLLLNAHSGFASYQWQDGSTDSTYLVTAPGLYYVTTTDACGVSFTDSVRVIAAPPIPFSVGPDRTKCNNDTLHLNAPSGFLNYTWSNNYNISSTTSQNVVVNPLVDTAYYVRAEKTPGCFAYDTVRITVHHSPPIRLGNDTSFCRGASITLDAGAGFSSYLWSNNSTSRQIQVAAVGVYRVTGTTAEGCKSYDTLEVKNVWPLPTPLLNKNNELCTGDTRTLNPGDFAFYVWNDGSASPTYSVNDVGMYWVEVMDSKGCVNSDTTTITTLLPLPKGFLPQDTAICNYGTLALQPLRSYNSYTWNTGSTSSSITIDKAGIYWLQVSDNKNCLGRDTILVNPKTCLVGVVVPTAFTPNKDNRNEVFKPAVLGPIKSYELAVYNRWGQVIFRTKDINKGWDGRVNGAEQKTDSFVCICTYQFEGEKVQQQKGTVVLIK